MIAGLLLCTVAVSAIWSWPHSARGGTCIFARLEVLDRLDQASVGSALRMVETELSVAWFGTDPLISGSVVFRSPHGDCIATVLHRLDSEQRATPRALLPGEIARALLASCPRR